MAHNMKTISTVLFLSCILLIHHQTMSMKRRYNNDIAYQNKKPQISNSITHQPTKRQRTIKTHFPLQDLPNDMKTKIIAACVPSAKNNLSKVNIEFNKLASIKRHSEILLKSPIKLARADQARFLHHYASEAGGLPIIDNLLNNGVSHSVQDQMLAVSPCRIAITFSHTEIASRLQSYGPDYAGRSLEIKLLMAIYKGDVEKMKEQIYEGASLQNITMLTKLATPAISVAAYLGHTNVISYFIEHYKNHIYHLSNAEQSALHVAARSGRTAVLELLLPHFKNKINKTDSARWTALHDAAYQGHTSAVQLLLEHNTQLGYHRITPFHLAARQGHTDILELLLPYFKNNINHQSGYFSYNHLTALHEAANNGRGDATSFLLQNGADPEIEDRYGNTPLLATTAHKKLHAITLLLDAQANINHINNQEQNCLHLIVRAKSEKHKSLTIAKLLIERGININAQDENGDTPLHYAATKNYTNMIKLLLYHNANKHAVNSRQKTPFGIARMKKFKEAVELFHQASNKKRNH